MRKKVSSIVLIILGWGLFLAPELCGLYQTVLVQKYVKEFQKETVNKCKDDRYESSLSYNRKIYEEKQSSFEDSWIYTENSLTDEWRKNDRLGYLTIPAMGIELPLYAGASKKHMECGAAVLAGTSLPIGGINTNCVIAGHRGYRGALLFKEIEMLKTGDKVYVTNPWEELVYIVESRKIIFPDDIESVKIQEGKDMVTLLTCHPYRGGGKYRYVVYCVRDQGQRPEETEIEGEIPFVSSQNEIQTENTFRFGAGILLAVLSIHILLRKGGKS